MHKNTFITAKSSHRSRLHLKQLHLFGVFLCLLLFIQALSSCSSKTSSTTSSTTVETNLQTQPSIPTTQSIQTTIGSIPQTTILETTTTPPPPPTTTAQLPVVTTVAPLVGRVVALTFDDGPDSNWTPKIAALLKESQVTGTFFMVGSNAKALPSIVKQIHDDGFRIAGHTMDHKRLSGLTEEEFAYQIDDGNAELTKITGEQIRCIRPPYRVFDSVVDIRLATRGLAREMWTIDSYDWKDIDVVTIVHNVLSQLQPGAIILMHDAGNQANTLEALPLIIAGIREQGYDFATVC